jgi:D-glycerate 3-kinase
MTRIKASAGFPAPLVDALLDYATAMPGKTPVFGIAGLQGSGKSTLAAQLARAGRQRGQRVAVLSLDDFYLGRRERLALGRRVHPLLATRGPPGTHAPELACAALDALKRLRRDGEILLPRFDKLADTRLPPSRWRCWRGRPDLVVFEGWCLEVPPQSAAELSRPVNALEREEDRDGRWRRHCNAALRSYAPLWARIDRLLFLQPPGFDCVVGWRWQQERGLVAARPGRRGMDRARLDRFVQLFERISRQALRQLPAIADRVVRLDAERRPLPSPTGRRS